MPDNSYPGTYRHYVLLSRSLEVFSININWKKLQLTEHFLHIQLYKVYIYTPYAILRYYTDASIELKYVRCSIVRPDWDMFSG